MPEKLVAAWPVLAPERVARLRLLVEGGRVLAAQRVILRMAKTRPVTSPPPPPNVER